MALNISYVFINQKRTQHCSLSLTHLFFFHFTLVFVLRSANSGGQQKIHNVI